MQRINAKLAVVGAIAALAVLAGATQSAHATYPGSNNGRIAFQITSALRELHPHTGSSLVKEPRLGSTE